MGRCISFGIFNKNYLYILYLIIVSNLKEIVYGYNYNDSFEPIYLGFKDNFMEFPLMRRILGYIGTIIMSLIFLYIFASKSKNEILLNKKVDSKSNFIYNKNNMTKKTLFLFSLIAFLWIVEEHLIEIFSSAFKDLDFWMLEIIILYYINSKLFKQKHYSHQKLIIYLNLILSLFKILAISLSFFGDKEENENNNKILYVTYYKFIPIIILVYLCLITLRSYVNIKIKWLMDSKFISVNNILLAYGIIGILLSSIACVITTIFKCPKNDFFSQICKVKSKNERIYFDNIIVYYNKFDYLEILRIIFCSLLFFFNKYYSLLIIKYFTPIHLIFSFPIYFFFKKIFLIFNTLFHGNFFIENKMENIEYKFILDISCDFLSFIGFTVYLELIELNFCGLNYNLGRHISIRAYSEIYESTDTFIIDNEEEED